MKHKPRILLLGDSIRMSYQPAVAEALSDVAEVVGPADNCQYSLYTLSSLERWLAELGTPEVVHWNNGLHDVGHNPDRRPVQFPIDAYRGNLELILHRLRETNARVLWATTTPVHPARPFVADQWSWRNEEIDEYNKAALDLMGGQGVPVNDLHGVVMADPDGLLAEDQLHLSPAGVARCAEAVVNTLRPALASG